MSPQVALLDQESWDTLEVFEIERIKRFGRDKLVFSIEIGHFSGGHRVFYLATTYSRQMFEAINWITDGGGRL